MNIILTTIVISFFCLGIRVLLSEGMIFHFIKEPFEHTGDSKIMNFLNRRLTHLSEENKFDKTQQYKKLSQKLSYILKPFLLCVVCFPSVWGTLLYILLFGFDYQLIVCIISSTFIIKIINDKFEF